MSQLRSNMKFEYNEKPRKKIKLNIIQDPNYDEFRGEMIEGEIVEVANHTNNHREEREIVHNYKDYQQEQARDLNLLRFIKGEHSKIRKINDAVIKVKVQDQNHIQNHSNVSKQPKTEVKTPHLINKSEKKRQLEKSQKKIEVSSNWKTFLEQSKSKKTLTSEQKTHNVKSITSTLSTSNSSKAKNCQFIGMDCQFVKCGDEDTLARISLVTEEGDCLYDSYVKPENQITDYVTNISGITFTHIKNAPHHQEVMKEIKKIINHKFVVGHTIAKDIEVCGLKDWKSWRGLIDIAEFELFKEKNGKLISLRNLSLKHLGKQIQDGWHSSVEDAQATINLFKIHKKAILKYFKFL